MSWKTPALLACSILSLALAGCGGGGPPPPPLPPPPVETVTLQSVPEFEQTLHATGDVEARMTIRHFPPLLSWAYSRFDLGAIPAGVTILTAELRVYQDGIAGPDVGPLAIDHARMGSRLEVSDVWNPPTLDTPLEGVAADRAEGIKTFDVYSAVRRDILEGLAFSDYRYRFEFHDRTSGTGLVLLRPRPTIVVTFTR